MSSLSTNLTKQKVVSYPVEYKATDRNQKQPNVLAVIDAASTRGHSLLAITAAIKGNWTATAATISTPSLVI